MFDLPAPRKIVCAIVLTSLMLWCPSRTAQGGQGEQEITVPRYKIVALGALPNRPHSIALAINNHGQVIGHSSEGGGVIEKIKSRRTFLWEKGKMRDLGTLPGYKLHNASAINNRGLIAGEAESDKEAPIGAITTKPFLWEKGKLKAFAPKGWAVEGITALNDRGEIVGGGQPGGWPHAFLYSNGKMHDLGEGKGQDINAHSQVLIQGDHPQKTFLWEKGKQVELPLDRVQAINDEGAILGDKMGRPFLWEKGEIRPLPSVAGESGNGFAMNNQKQIVGWVYLNSENRAVLWHRGKAHDLNNLIDNPSDWVVAVAYGINDKGQIVGFGYRRSEGLKSIFGTSQAFLLTPVNSEKHLATK